MAAVDRNSLAFWFPPLEAAGLPVPRTEIVTTEVELVSLLDGQLPEGFESFLAELGAAAERIGFPCFLRTGHGAGKHEWAQTCFLADRASLPGHVAALVDWSYSVDFFGLPTDVWVVRELIATAAQFHAFTATGAPGQGMPITREFRLFVEAGPAGEASVSHIQSYWPADAIRAPSAPDWEERLAAISVLEPAERAALVALALAAVNALGGSDWSVDLLQAADGRWWLTDLAEAERSFRYGSSL